MNSLVFLVGFVFVFFEGSSPTVSMLGQKKLESISLLIVHVHCSNSLFIWSIYISVWPKYSSSLLSTNQNSSADLLKLSVRVLAVRTNYGPWEKMNSRSPRITINPKFFLTPNFKWSAEEFQFAERRGVEIFWPNRYVNASYEQGVWYDWPILEQFMGKYCQICSCPDRLSKLRHFFICWRAFTQNNTKPAKTIKKSHKTSWFQALFLQWTCGHHHQYPDRQGSLFHVWKKWGFPILTSCYCRLMLSMCVQGVRMTVQGVI